MKHKYRTTIPRRVRVFRNGTIRYLNSGVKARVIPTRTITLTEHEDISKGSIWWCYFIEKLGRKANRLECAYSIVNVNYKYLNPLEHDCPSWAVCTDEFLRYKIGLYRSARKGEKLKKPTELADCVTWGRDCSWRFL